MNGILNINKPPGITSFGVVARIKRLSGERRVGHAGTLDPLASGVLPVCLGHATRVVEYLMELPKTYRARIEFGVVTDSGDSAGNVLSRADASSVSRVDLLASLDRFKGSIEQVPPMFSALKHHGIPLYKFARMGINIERKSRITEVYELQLTDWEPPFASIVVTCSSGTYIRTLAEDLGRDLGCGATLRDLVRSKYGPFDVREAASLESLPTASGPASLESLLHPIDSVLADWPSLRLEEQDADDASHGRPLADSQPPARIDPGALDRSKGRVRAYALDGTFLGVLRFNSEKLQWLPEKIFV